MSRDLNGRIKSVVAATFGVPESSVTAATSNANVEGWDSMNHIHLIVALESEFGVAFDPEQAITLTSIVEIERALGALGVR